MKMTYKHTKYASYIGYITQAIINNLPPLLFIIFNKELKISIEQLGFLISFNFGIEILTDLIAAKYVDRIGYRTAIVFAHIFSFFGLIGLGIFPIIFENSYAALLIAMGINAIGGGLIEVLISPIVEALPGEEKASAMSLLHSFYCWGHVSVVLLSTVFFNLVGLNHWYILPLIWSVIPLLNIFLF